ncbi:MAG TPA: glutathione S-transferase family protein [Myxococcota bacterium]|nr:glutathione S-transferase family protein [Myxococcota bacterium]
MSEAAREIVVYGIADSVYVQIARLTLREKGVPHRVEPVDPFVPGGAPAAHLARQPFGKIPAFRHGDFALYETTAIARYVDEAFAGPRLQPESPSARARMNQAIAILDAYAYRTLVWDLYVERCVKRERADEARIASALPRAATCLRALSDLAPSAEWLAGDELTLADFHAAPIFAYFALAPESAALFGSQPRLSRWWKRMRARPSVREIGPTESR